MFIGIDIGGTHIRVGRGEKGQVEQRTEFLTKDFHTNLQQIKDSVKSLSGDTDIEKIGVGVPGPLESKNNKTLHPPHLDSTWHNIEIGDAFSQILNTKVVVGHDASIAALAEYHYGAGKGTNPMVYITVSTGIGVGLILNGRIFKGVFNPEPGHQILDKTGVKCLCGQTADLETYSSGEMIEIETGKKPVEVETTTLWKNRLDWLSIGIANLVLFYSPQAIVVGGGMTKHNENFFPLVKSSLAKHLYLLPLVPIVPANLGQEAGLVGALTLAEKG